MLLFLSRVLLIVVTVFITACSSQSDLISHAFINTHIEENNAKMFTFYATPIANKQTKSSPQKGNQAQEKEGGRDKGKEGQNQKKNNNSQINSRYDNKHNEQADLRKALLEQLEITLKEKKYCREGYIKLSTNVGIGLSKIKGECHESATDEDRQRFPNTH